LLKVITDFGQSIASSLDLEAVARSVLDNVVRLVSADTLELKVKDEDTQTFVSYRFQESNGSGRKLVRSNQSQFGGLSEKVIRSRAPLFLADARSTSGKDAGGAITTPFQSYMGVPLFSGGEMVGCLEVAQATSAAFAQHDFDLLQLISGQVGAALSNAMLYEKERRRTAELSGLASLAQAVSAIQDPKDLFARLVDSVAPLFEAEIIGFLLYDENKRTLEGQVPFRGLPPHIVQIYRAAIGPDSAAQMLIAEQRPILTLNASEDEDWRTLGLTDIAVAASLRDSALMPLVSAGHMVGYFQVSHHKN